MLRQKNEAKKTASDALKKFKDGIVVDMTPTIFDIKKRNPLPPLLRKVRLATYKRTPLSVMKTMYHGTSKGGHTFDRRADEVRDFD